MLNEFKMKKILSIIPVFLLIIVSCKDSKPKDNNSFDSNMNNKLMVNSEQDTKYEMDSDSETKTKQFAEPETEISIDDKNFSELLRSNVIINKLDNKYSIVSNVDCDTLVKLDKDYELSGIKLSADKEWWILIDMVEKRIAQYSKF